MIVQKFWKKFESDSKRKPGENIFSSAWKMPVSYWIQEEAHEDTEVAV